MNLFGNRPPSRFKRHFDIVLGKMLQPESGRPSDIQLPYLRAANVHDGYVNLDDIKTMWFSQPEKKRFTVNRGDLLVLEGGDVGRCALWSEESRAIGFQNSLHRLRPFDGNDNRFAAYWLSHLKSSGYFEVVCSKSTLAHFTGEKFREAPFPEVAFDVQITIADFLDREINQIDQLILKKERMVTLVLEGQSANLDLLTVSSHKHEKLDRIPLKWVCRIPSGQVDPRQEPWIDFPLIAPNHIESGTGRILLIESARDQAAESGKYTFPKGTVLYSKIRPALTKACIAPSTGLCSADMYPIIPSSKLLPHYLLMQLLSRSFTNWAVIESMRVAMPKINREALGTFRLAIPPMEMQTKLVDTWISDTTRIEKLVDQIKLSILKLHKLRSALICDAVTGQLDPLIMDGQYETNKYAGALEDSGVLA